MRPSRFSFSLPSSAWESFRQPLPDARRIAASGRAFSADEDRAEGPRAAILGYGLWRRRFDADKRVIGRSIELNGASATIVGVMPANFSHLYATPYGTLPELWYPG
jgi:hypothetical protein